MISVDFGGVAGGKKSLERSEWVEATCDWPEHLVGNRICS